MIPKELEQLEQALSLTPNNLYLRYLIAQKYQQIQQWQSAEDHLLYILKMDRDNEEAAVDLLKTYFHSQKYDASLMVGEDLETRNKNNLLEEILYYRSLCYLRLRKNEECIKATKAWKSINPNAHDEELDNAFIQKIGVGFDESQESDWTDQIEFELRGMIEKPTIDFSHVGGMNQVKREIDLKIIKPLEHHSLFSAYGKKIGGGLLLYGPPGCGKTFIARATAGQIKVPFINIGIDDILDKYYGESEHKLSSLFALARSKSPCVLFIDEVDALAGNRTEFRGNTGRSVINQLLSEMDGVENVNDGLLIIGATNTPWYIDPAFKRPGRFDKMIFVPPPDLGARDEIVQVILKGKPVQFVDVHKISEKTESYSGADLVQIVEQAIEKKFEASLSEGKVIPLNTNDILEEIKRYKPTTKDWFLTARNYANYANQTGFYDDVAQYIKKLKL